MTNLKSFVIVSKKKEEKKTGKNKQEANKQTK